MSNQDFDVYLARASNLSQRYRDEATDKPSQAIDSLILTASRRAPVPAATIHAASWFTRWRVPLSIAAVMMLTVGMTLRMVMQEAKLSSPAAVTLPQQQNATLPAKVNPPEAKAPTESPAAADVARKPETGTEVEKEILIDARPAQAFPSAPPSMPADKMAEPMPSPILGDRKSDAVEKQAGGGSSSNDLGKMKSAPAPEKDSSSVAVPSATVKRDDDMLPRRVEPPAAKAAEGQLRVAPEIAEPAKSELPPTSQIDGPRLPEGHHPVVDGKTYRAGQAKTDDESAVKKENPAAAAIIDNIEDAPEAWLRRVAELRRVGRNNEANVELERFRKRYPNYPAPIEQ